MDRMQGSIVERRLGASAAHLHSALGEVSALARSPQTKQRLARIGLDVLCGAYHDYRSLRVLPKGDLITALRAVPADPEVDDAIAGLVTRIVLGEFDEAESEAARWASKYLAGLAPKSSPRLPDEPLATISLTDRERRAHTWLYRYVEVYDRGPIYQEMQDGMGLRSIEVSELLRQLAKKGAAVKLAGKRGWLPTRAP